MRVWKCESMMCAGKVRGQVCLENRLDGVRGSERTRGW